MRLYYVSDVHGSEKCLRRFLGAARFCKHEARLVGKWRRAAGEAELDKLEKHVRFNDF
jgi:hypothetical protein